MQAEPARASQALGIEFATSESSNTPALLLKRITEEMRRTSGAGNRPGKLAWRILEAIYRQEPLLQRGIKKHAGDLVKEGFIVTLPGKEDAHPDNDALLAWFREIGWESKAAEDLINAHVYGTGPMEVEWDDNAPGTEPVKEGASPVGLHIVDPAHCDFETRKDSTGKSCVFLIQRVPGYDIIELHPDRYHAPRLTKLPGFFHGLSTVETAYHTAMSKIKADQGLGEVVFFAGQSKLHAQVKDAKPGEVETVSAMLASPDFTRAITWDDRLMINQLNPTALNPEPFYKVFLQSIAAAIGIPSMLLEGAQAGAVTGSETNLADYHSDLRQVQVNVLEPIVTSLIVGKTGLKPSEFDIRWNEQPVGKSAEAKAAVEMATAFQLLTGSGIAPLAAARIVGLNLTEEDLKEDPAGHLPADAAINQPPMPPGAPVQG